MQARQWTVLSFLPKTFALRDPINEYVTGTMTIDNGNQIVEVHVRSGQLSSDTIFDYSTVSISKNLPRLNLWRSFLTQTLF